MKKTLTVLVLMIANVFIFLPADATAQRGDRSMTRQRGDRSYTRQRSSRRGSLWQPEQRRRRVMRHRRNQNTYGYRNYGQYRRTQVGNRRYRMVRRPYWDGGVRRYRLVRVYY